MALLDAKFKTQEMHKNVCIARTTRRCGFVDGTFMMAHHQQLLSGDATHPWFP
jgi:hypothetical protein